MYLPSHFNEARPDVLRAFVRDHPLGLLVTQSRAGGIDANSVPFILDAEGDSPGVLRAHVARANPVWKEARSDVESLVVFQGPQAYVSPAWYPSKAEHGKVVPTWNYVMVQARGTVRFIDDAEWLRRFVTRLTDHHEAVRTAATSGYGAMPWAVSDAPADFVDTMLRAIVGVEIVLSSLVGKWKVSQNRSAADRAGTARGLGEVAGSDAAAMAQQVREPGATA